MHFLVLKQYVGKDFSEARGNDCEARGNEDYMDWMQCRQNMSH